MQDSVRFIFFSALCSVIKNDNNVSWLVLNIRGVSIYSKEIYSLIKLDNQQARRGEAMNNYSILLSNSRIHT